MQRPPPLGGAAKSADLQRPRTVRSAAMWPRRERGRLSAARACVASPSATPSGLQRARRRRRRACARRGRGCGRGSAASPPRPRSAPPTWRTIGTGLEADRVAGVPDAPAEVGVLAVEEEALVEAADGLEERRGGPACTRRTPSRRSPARVVGRGVADQLVGPRRLRPQPVQEERLRERRALAREAPAAARELVAGLEDPRAGQRRRRVGAQAVQQRVERRGLDARVRVEEQQERARRRARRRGCSRRRSRRCAASGSISTSRSAIVASESSGEALSTTVTRTPGSRVSGSTQPRSVSALR